jgi:hypothetical protein
MRAPINSLPSVSPYSFEVSLIGLGILLTILTLVSILITGPLLASELLTISLRTKYHDPQVTSMYTKVSGSGTPVLCQGLILLVLAPNLDEALNFTIEELPLKY